MNITTKEHILHRAYYRIAGHLLYIQFPEGIDLDQCLPNFSPFEISKIEDEEPTLEFKLNLSPAKNNHAQTKLLSDLSIVWGDRFRFEESENHYITNVESDQKTGEWKMFSSKDFQRSTIHVLETELYQTTILSWLIMVAFGQAILPFDSLMIHASVVEKDDEAYAFLGKSGTGKSTHSRLWIQHLENFNLLNDDNPAIRILTNNKVMIYGTPWSGKTPCYRNEAAELKGIIRLSQANVNKFTIQKDVAAFITLLPSCSSIRWNNRLFTHMNNTVQKIIHLSPIGLLDCLPDMEAAQLAYEHIKKEKITTLNKIENE